MSYGSGTLFQRGQRGIWYYQAYVDGQQVGPFSSGSTNREDAQSELDRLLGQRARGELAPTPKGLSIAKLIDDYLLHAEEELSVGTRRMYKAALQLHVKPFFGKFAPQKLTTELLRRYRNKCSRETVQKYAKTGLFDTGKPVTQASINRELVGLRAALRYALKVDHRLHFHVPHFPLSKEKNVRTGFLREDKSKELYNALPYPGVRALAASSFYTGVRRGELTKVNWDQVDFPVGVIALYDTKNGETRAVPIVPGLMEEALREARTERDQFYPDCDAVFAFEGRRITSSRRSWETACEKVKVDGLLFHDMRRSANRNMRDAGLPQSLRMRIMGHKTASMDRRYGIVDLTDIQIAREMMSKRQAQKPEPARKRQNHAKSSRRSTS
jgi:integrase